MKIAHYTIVILLLSLIGSLLQSQTSIHVPQDSSGTTAYCEIFHLAPSDSLIRLSSSPLVEGSDSVVVNGEATLTRGEEYRVDAAEGSITLYLGRGRFSSLSNDSVRIEVFYRDAGQLLREVYRLRRIEPVQGRSVDTSAGIVGAASAFKMEDVIGPSLRKSGSLFRGFSVGSNRDLSLQSGFRLQLDGKITDDMKIVAALSDENSPIQPEGTTQQLQELDRVFIQLSSGEHSATLGDFVLERAAPHARTFGKMSRKVQGARGVLSLASISGGGVNGEIFGAAATNRGKYHTNYFQGVEGTQGPFRLTGKNGERQIIIVAGTEKVYLNGEEMLRGETNDFIIDYAGGEVFFTGNRLITNASRITVDFEYTDRSYSRNLLAGSASVAILDQRARVSAFALRESDDRESPIELSLNDDLRQVLERGGADRLRASVSGVRFVGIDSLSGLGRGQYARIDTTVEGQQVSLYRFLPGSALALYAVTFSAVSQVPEDSIGYRRVKIGHFEVAGKGQGEYLPIQLLPLPSQHDFLDIAFDGKVSAALSVEGELALSRQNLNTFSSRSDVHRKGAGYSYRIHLDPTEIEALETQLGQVSASYSERFVEEKFLPPDRYNDIEFDRKWDSFESPTGDETIREVAATYKPAEGLGVQIGYGSLQRENVLGSKRWHGSLTVAETSMPKIVYAYEAISSTDARSAAGARWTRQSGRSTYDFWHLRPGIRFEHEKRLASGQSSRPSASKGFRIFEISPSLETRETGRLKAMAEFGFRSEDSTIGGDLRRALAAFTQRYMLQVREWNDFSGTLALNLRRTEFTSEFRNRGNTDTDIMLVRVDSRFTPLDRALTTDLYYEFANHRSASFERVFVRVPTGIGNYRYRGDLNGNGIADENEFELTRFDGEYIVISVPGDQLVPVVDLKASIRIRLNVARLLGSTDGLLAEATKALSTETYLRVDEKSADPDASNIYLLKLSSFQQEGLSLRGGDQVTQDVHLFESSPDFSLRFRYDARRGFLKLVASSERSRLLERSLRLRWQPIREVGNQTDLVLKSDRAISSVPSLRNRDLDAVSLLTDFFYRPEREWEIGLKAGFSSTEDRFGGRNVTANLNTQGIRLVYAFLGRGQLRIELDREEVGLARGTQESSGLFPFEFTGGRDVGKTYLLQVGIDYRLNQNLQLMAQYLGRSERRDVINHSARVEARAFF
ncbi:MAG: hypothetical protein FJ215_03300 [Ignavibacteria bacterium]|nr:hypothetical protein [Ignavibacteria bacterium]